VYENLQSDNEEIAQGLELKNRNLRQPGNNIRFELMC